MDDNRKTNEDGSYIHRHKIRSMRAMDFNTTLDGLV